MNQLRAASKTEEGKERILQSPDSFFKSLSEDLRNVDALAVLANLFAVDGEDAPVLRILRSSYPSLLSDLISLVQTCVSSQPPAFLAICFCIGNAWAQSKAHREDLSQAPPVFLNLVHNERFGHVILRGLLNMVAVDEDLALSHVSSLEVESLVTLAEKENNAIAVELVLSSLLFLDKFPSVLLPRLGSILGKAPASDRFDFLLECVKSDSTSVNSVLEQNGVLEGLDDSVSSLEILLHALTSQPSNNTLYSKLASFIPRWASCIEDTTRLIPHETDLRHTDQSLVLPHATKRLYCLQLLAQFSAHPEHMPMLFPNAGLLGTLCDQYVEYDFEATRAALICLKNMCLFDADRFALVASQVFPNMLYKLLVSKDHHTAFIASGVFRTLCVKTSNTDPLLGKEVLLAILALDFTKIHPHSRVELSRAFASLMSRQDSLTPPQKQVLETIQSVKFVSFLLSSHSPEMQIEGLNGLAALPASFVKALPGFEIEISTGSLLVDRIQEIYANTKDSVESIAMVRVGQTCEALLKAMDLL